MSRVELDPRARAFVEEYLASVRDALRGSDVPSSEILGDLRSHIEEAAAGGDGSLESVREIVAEIGSAEQFRQAADETSDSAVHTGGRVLGVPFDFTTPTVARFAARWWNPTDPHILVPRVWGIGWSVNFAAIAVRAGWMRPDDEDAIPFGNVPDRVLVGAMVVPTLIALAGIAAAVVAWPHLPDQVPTHWGIDGQPDQWGDKLSAIGTLLVFGVGPVILGWLAGFRRGTSRAVRAFWAAGTVMFSALASGLIGVTIYSATREAGAWWIWVIIVAALAATFVMLLVMSRLGLHAEWRGASDTSER